jgi:hypothetical protein
VIAMKVRTTATMDRVNFMLGERWACALVGLDERIRMMSFRSDFLAAYISQDSDYEGPQVHRFSGAW